MDPNFEGDLAFKGFFRSMWKQLPWQFKLAWISGIVLGMTLIISVIVLLFKLIAMV